jgi:hypothetical protein
MGTVSVPRQCIKKAGAGLRRGSGAPPHLALAPAPTALCRRPRCQTSPAGRAPFSWLGLPPPSCLSAAGWVPPPPSRLANPPADRPPRPPVRAPLCAVNGNLNRGDFNGNKNGNFNKGDLNGNGGCGLPVHKKNGGRAGPIERRSAHLLALVPAPAALCRRPHCPTLPLTRPAPACACPSLCSQRQSQPGRFQWEQEWQLQQG